MTAVCQPIIMQNINSEQWPARFASYQVLENITRSCAESFAKNIDGTLQIATKGIKDGDTRVRYAAFGALSALMTELAPYV